MTTDGIPTDTTDARGHLRQRRRRQRRRACRRRPTESLSRFQRWKLATGGGLSLFPLAVLFGLNAADELDRNAFGVLLPEIRDSFGLDTSGILTVVSLSLVAGAHRPAHRLLVRPLAAGADRADRRRRLGVLLGADRPGPHARGLGIARAGAGLGRAVNDPVHNSLLADYYDIPVRPRIYGVHRYANALGQFLGPLSGGLMAYYWGWRSPFLVFGVVTMIFVIMGLRLREPLRGYWERKAMGACRRPWPRPRRRRPVWAESFRIIWQVRSLRRIFFSLPFVAIALVGLATLGGLYYDEVWGLNEAQRGIVAAILEGGAQLAGLLVGIPLATRLMMKGAGHVMRFLAVVTVVITAAWAVFALAPWFGLAIAANAVISGSFFLLVPGIYAVLSLAVPAKVRSFGFAIGTLWILPGLLLLPVVGHAGRLVRHPHGPAARRPGVHGRRLAAGVGRQLRRARHPAGVEVDRGPLRGGAAAQAGQGQAAAVPGHRRALRQRAGPVRREHGGRRGRDRGPHGHERRRQVDPAQGHLRPGAGQRRRGGVRRADMTHTPPDEIAGRRGVVVVPGGQGVFTQLSVADNLRLAAWNRKARSPEVRAEIERVLDMFPVLRERLHEPAGNLSGGQQQMLTLGMAFIGKPRLLMIDELSLGLAPVVVGQLLEMVRSLRDEGTDDHPGRAVGQRGAHGGRPGLLHGEGRGPLRGPDQRAAGPARPAALGVPAGGGGRGRERGGRRPAPACGRAPRCWRSGT